MVAVYGDKVDGKLNVERGQTVTQLPEPVKKSHLLLQLIADIMHEQRDSADKSLIELEGLNTNLEEQVTKQNVLILAELKETNRNLGILARAMLTLSEQLSAADKVTIAKKPKAKGKS